MPARSGLFGASVLCADSLPEAMAHAVDLGTIRDRCSFTGVTDVTDVTTRTAGGSGSGDVICTHTDTLEAETYCASVGKDTCNTTSMKNGIMCTWSEDICKSTKQAGNELKSWQCTSSNR